MSIDSVQELVRILSKYPLLEPAQRDELDGILKAQYTDPLTLSKELLLRGWLTPYQVNQLFQDRGPELMLGSYVLIERLTEGAVGQLFRARHLHMKRPVALQVVRPELLRNPEAVERFYQEIQAVSQLSSQYLLAAYDAGPIGNTHFFAMEYVEGLDLERLVQQSGPLPVEYACECVRQAALGLQHAFERGLLHHDMRPSNLLLARVGGLGQATTADGSSSGGPQIKIRNLGLTLIRQHTKHTRLQPPSAAAADAGAAVDYLAPERGTPADAGDVRSELYSLGCTFYFLLTGQVPFPADTAADKRRQQTEEPVPVDSLRPQVPAAVAAVIRKLMAKAPEDRYQQPAEVAVALASFGAPVAVPPPANGVAAPKPSAYHRRKQIEHHRRRRLVWAGSAVLAVGLIFFILLLAWPGSRPPAQTGLAETVKPLAVTVEASRSWQDTHVDLSPNDAVVLRARGKWRRGPKGTECGPEGNPADVRDRCLIRDEPAMTLLAMVGADGPVAVGPGRTIDSKTGGRLLIQANDLDLRDNLGTLTVEIQGGRVSAEDVVAWQYGWGDVDAGAKKVKTFTPLPFWPKTGIWADKDTLPVEGNRHLHWKPDAGVGHPGPNHWRAAIRRWVVPHDGSVALRGTLVHPGTQGDGVQGWLISSRLGAPGGPWIADKNKIETKVARLEVKRGDIIDLVVDCRANDDSDRFEWTPVLEWAK